MICITCPILHEIVCIDLICNGYVLAFIEVELINSYQFGLFFLQRKFSIFLRNDRDCKIFVQN